MRGKNKSLVIGAKKCQICNIKIVADQPSQNNAENRGVVIEHNLNAQRVISPIPQNKAM